MAGTRSIAGWLYRWLRGLHGVYRVVRAPTAVGVSAIIEDAMGRVLLIRHSYRWGWHLPGGGVDRGEAPIEAVVREAREEVGLITCGPPQLLGVFLGRMGWIGNLVVLYRLPDAEIDFKPNFEVREIRFADPSNPPPDTASGVRRRLAELSGTVPQHPCW